MLNKKAAIEAVVVLILALVAIAIYAVFQQVYAEQTVNSLDREACRDSVLLRYNQKQLVDWFPGKDPSKDLSCKTNNVLIKKSNRDEVIETIANEMYDCSNQFWHGTVDFLSDDDFSLFGNNDNLCYICSKITYDKSTTNEIEYLEIKNIEKYLNTMNPPLHNQTYSEIFLQSKNAKIDFGTNGKFVINERSPSYVVFLVSKFREGGAINFLERTKDNLKWGIGGALAGGVGVTSIILGSGAVAAGLISLPVTLTVGAVALVVGGVGTMVVKEKRDAGELASGVLLLSSEQVPSFCDELG